MVAYTTEVLIENLDEGPPSYMLVLEIEHQQAEGKRVAFRAGAAFARSLILAWSRYTSPTASSSAQASKSATPSTGALTLR